MRHLNGYRKLGRDSSHRRAMLRNMATSLVLHERIETTVPKAKELRGIVDRMITLGKRGDLHARRMAASYLFDDEAVSKVFGDLADRFRTRPGGYTRILKKGFRFGDGADIALLELVDYQSKGVSGGELNKATVKSDKPKAKKAAKPSV
ncbi:MAG: 50S ribosomal protein L17 [Proteobacteria bacterium]|nr:50S ribosomal protein L17 [Pseudomonadota bacterium]